MVLQSGYPIINMYANSAVNPRSKIEQEKAGRCKLPSAVTAVGSADR